MNKQKTNGFTLVELIIVVTILGILSTIAFVSFQGYSKNARDSNRLETMSIIQKGISLNQITTSKTLLPDDYTQVLASGSLLGYEGIVGESVTRGIQMNIIPKDPIRGDNYIYYTNKDRNKVQVMGFLEGEDLAFIGIERANAAGSGTKIPKVSGDRLGILLDVNNNRVTGTGLDILLTNSGTSYTTYFSNTDTLTSSGKDLYSKVYNRREDLLKDKTLASLDDSLVGYWDMETTTLSGGVTVLKDFSKYSNNGTCYNSGTIVNCGTIGSGPQFVEGNGKKGKAMSFDGMDDRIIMGNASSLKVGTGNAPKTIIAIFTRSTSSAGNAHKNIAGFYYGSANGGNFCLEHNYERLFFYGHASDVSGSELKYDNWYGGAVSYDGQNVKLFLNGKLDNSANYTLNTQDGPFYIGSYVNYSPSSFKGNVDEVRLYNRALSDIEVQQLYNSIK